MLTSAQLDFWKQHRFLKLPNLLSDADKQTLSSECDLLFTADETPGKWMKYFEMDADQRKLCRIENFIDYFSYWKNLMTGPKMMSTIDTLLGEPGVLFKEKINFKLSGSKGFTPHQDAPAFISFKQTFHITLMIAIDNSTLENGCLQVAKSAPKKQLMMDKNPDGSLTEQVCESIEWQALPCHTGDVLLFDSYLPHYSEPNFSNRSRRALFATYNRLSEGGDKRQAYYADKRDKFPPECERIPGKDYSAGAAIYNVANPIPVVSTES